MKRSFLLMLMLFTALNSIANVWKPVGDKIKTRWADKVTADNVWQSYPRTQLQRESWVNLNGLWEYAVTNQQMKKNDVKFDGEILVPFAIESSLSGVQRSFLPTDKLWYRREFSIPKDWNNQDVILHFCAVDYECTLWINGKEVGSHKGGNNPFEFNITKFLKNSGTQTLELSVVDPTDTESITRGKQQLNQTKVWYTPVSGIWQTVWMEPVGKSYIEQVLPVADIDNMKVALDVNLNRQNGDERVKIDVIDNGEVIKTVNKKLSEAIEIDMSGATLWSPSSPKLYNLNISLFKGKEEIDFVKSYFTMRKIESKKDECGYNRIFLNNQPIFQYGTLDQGWWPDGLLTPPCEEAMLWDMVQLKDMGFNTIRKHLKVEPEQYYYYADSLGLMLWQDMVSGFATSRKKSEHVQVNATEDWDAPLEHTKQWQGELFEMIDRLRFYGSITSWVIFNEGWGQHNTVEIVNKVMECDKSRVINGVTGSADRGVGHTCDKHNYPLTAMILPEYNGDRISVLGEFGGYGLVVHNHLWDSSKQNWGYKDIDNPIDFLASYKRAVFDLENLVAQGLGAAIYTQTTDVEGEVNGLITYDREVVKIPKKLLHLIHNQLYKIESVKPKTLIRDSQGGKTNYRQVSINKSQFNSVELPLHIDGNKSVCSQTTFSVDKKYQNISLWLNVMGDVKVWLNGVEVINQYVKQTHYHSHFSISDYSNYLKIGENSLKIEVVVDEKMDFDYGLTAF